MLLASITLRRFNYSGWRVGRLHICHEAVDTYFNVPGSATKITIRVHDRPAAQRVQMRAVNEWAGIPFTSAELEVACEEELNEEGKWLAEIPWTMDWFAKWFKRAGLKRETSYYVGLLYEE